MDTKNLWEQFEATGSIESYMKYRGFSDFDMDGKAVEYKNVENSGINY